MKNIHNTTLVKKRKKSNQTKLKWNTNTLQNKKNWKLNETIKKYKKLMKN